MKIVKIALLVALLGAIIATIVYFLTPKEMEAKSITDPNELHKFEI